ncbi:unnamed protein product, partial [Closterium sp. NIES-53]
GQPQSVVEEKEWVIGEGMAKEEAEALKEVLSRYKAAFAYRLKEVGRCNMAEVTIELTTEIPVYQRLQRMTLEEIQICTEKCQELMEAGFIRKSNSGYAAATVVAARTDLTGQGFIQILMAEADKKTAFHGADGQYEWHKLLFGLKSASPEFHSVMNQVLCNVPNAACYIVDVIVYSVDGRSHVRDVEAALKAIQEAGLTCQPGKCKFGQTTVEYLGFEKVCANFSRRATVLNQLLRDDHKWEWGPEQEKAVQDLMGAVKNGAVLELPKAGVTFTLYTDWSSAGMGAVLTQMKGEVEKLVAFASQSCNAAEVNYS